MDAVDARALAGTYDIAAAHPAWVAVWDLLCTVFGPTAFRLVGLVVTILALMRRNRRAVVLVLTADVRLGCGRR
ncbi:MAG: hypothetical protein ACSLE6_12350 [Mycobacterium sp.]